MPCNPAVGGTAKGHLVREIDALGGLMGRAIDATGIQFKLLNRSRGPGGLVAARAGGQEDLRAVGDGGARRRAEHRVADRQGRAHPRRETAASPASRWRTATPTRAAPLVITTGTFLNGLIHIGPEQRPAGRAGEPPSRELAESLKSFGFEWGRLKTGTPPRLDRESIDFERQVARGVFARRARRRPAGAVFVPDRADRAAANRLLSAAHQRSRPRSRPREHRSHRRCSTARFSGIGPRYCPSLEDKIVRFPDKERHQIFLEPEGVDAREIYVNGFSMSLPRDVQADLSTRCPGSKTR